MSHLFAGTYSFYDEYLAKVCLKIMAQNPTDSRNGKVKKIFNVVSTFDNPRDRMSQLKSRKAVPTITKAETAWVLSGTNHLSFLLPYLPRASQWSDDGESWRAGYGPRIFEPNYEVLKSTLDDSIPKGDNPEGTIVVSQFEAAMIDLHLSKDSRQAVMSILDPAEDIPAMRNTKDFPCNNWLNFWICDEGRIHLNVTIRSNDIIWGNLINFHEWSVTLEAASVILGRPMGTLTLFQTNAHIYEAMWDRAREIIAEFDNNDRIVDVKRQPYILSEPKNVAQVLERTTAIRTACGFKIGMYDDTDGFKRVIKGYSGLHEFLREILDFEER